MTSHLKELSRIRKIYQERIGSQEIKNLYSWYQPDVLLNHYFLRTKVAALFIKNNLTQMSNLRILDFGCGDGWWLRYLLECGATPNNLHGVELMEERIQKAQSLSPNISVIQSQAFNTSFESNSFDIVSANTVFSSILSPEARTELALEMKRILKPRGHILIYDFKVQNPFNPNTVPMTKKIIQELFPDFKLDSKSLTLAPPIARRISKLSVTLTYLLEVLIPFLRTHSIHLLSPLI